jgi:hypothetical protein
LKRHFSNSAQIQIEVAIIGIEVPSLVQSYCDNAMYWNVTSLHYDSVKILHPLTHSKKKIKFSKTNLNTLKSLNLKWGLVIGSIIIMLIILITLFNEKWTCFVKLKVEITTLNLF